MDKDQTQKQSPSQRRAAEQLSRPRSRPPAEVPGYDLERQLGRGAYGEVWVATAKNTGRRVAIKFYHHHADLEDSMVAREVEKLVFLSADRYVVQLLEVGWHADPPYYVMEYIPNGSLEDLLKRDGTLPVDEALHVFKDVVIGMLHAHGKGIFHCDLKPGNVLLDQDGKARIADFGQARLSHEQKPSLGTLFFMAPEQANIEAVPDVRWDVYALGALLYTMLTGQPPFRSAVGVSKIDSSAALKDRLSQYQELIHRSPPPDGHKKVAGVDRELVEIIDRSIALNPRERYRNVQEVLDALQDRERNSYRRPLLILGVVGPVLMLVIAMLFGWWGYRQAVAASERGMVSKAFESNQYGAKLAATNAANSIGRYFVATEKLSRDPEFLALFRAKLENPELRQLLAQLRASQVTAGQQTPERIRFVNHPDRVALQERIEQQFQLDGIGGIASWFVTDDHGFHMASAFDVPPAVSPIGGYYGYRSYFHGQMGDLPADAEMPPPISETQLSALFRSTASGTWKVAISAPIFIDDEVVGVVALTVDVGQFQGIETAPHQFAVLVDGRDTESKGTILQHPLFDRLEAKGEAVPVRFSDQPEFRMPLEIFRQEQPVVYEDPLSRDPLGADFQGQWIAAAHEVMIPSNGNPTDYQGTGWIMVVQEELESAVGPVRALGRQLAMQGALALVAITAVVAALWLVVFRAWRATPRFAGAGGETITSQELHSIETIAAPKPPPKPPQETS